jgi:hypothetical protein
METNHYEIKVKGHISERWSKWFNGLAILHESNCVTILSGLITDQAALQGILLKIYNLGLQLISIKLIDDERRE